MMRCAALALAGLVLALGCERGSSGGNTGRTPRDTGTPGKAVDGKGPSSDSSAPGGTKSGSSPNR